MEDHWYQSVKILYSSENSCGGCFSDFRNASLIEPDTLSKITSNPS